MVNIRKVISQEQVGQERITERNADRKVADSAHESVTVIPKQQRKLNNKKNNLGEAGKEIASKGKTKADYNNKSLRHKSVQWTFPSQEEQARKGKLAGKMAFYKNRPLPDFTRKEVTPEYKKAYLAGYNEYLSKNKSQQGDSRGPSPTSNSIKFIGDSPETRVEDYKEEFNSELFYPHESLFPSLGFPNLSTPGVVSSVGYFERLKPQQKSNVAINSMGKTEDYVDSLISQEPNYQTPNPLSPRDMNTSLNFDMVVDLLAVYEVIQSKQLKQSQLNKNSVPQPLIFSERSQAQQQNVQNAKPKSTILSKQVNAFVRI